MYASQALEIAATNPVLALDKKTQETRKTETVLETRSLHAAVGKELFAAEFKGNKEGARKVVVDSVIELMFTFQEKELKTSTVHNAVQLGDHELSVSSFTVIAVGVVQSIIEALICKSFIDSQFEVNQIHHFTDEVHHNDVEDVATLQSKP